MTFPIKNIVAAVDADDDLANAILHTAIRMSDAFDAALHVIDVWPKLQMVGYPYARKAEIEEIENYTRDRNQRLDVLKARVAAFGGKAVISAPVGEKSQPIKAYIDSVEADLLVIGSHQKGFWDQLTGKSFSSSVIHKADCAVLVVPPAFAQKLDDMA